MTTECCLYQGKVVNYFIPSHYSGGKVKNTETQNMEFEPKEKVQCPRKYEISLRKCFYSHLCYSSCIPYMELSCNCYDYYNCYNCLHSHSYFV